MTIHRRFLPLTLFAALAGPIGLVLLASLLPSGASAHFTNCDSVDYPEIRWTGTTVLAAERDYAIATWNATGIIDIVRETPQRSATVKFEDVRRPDKTWAGRYSCRWAKIDVIKFNRALTDGASVFARRWLALHELGHALRLDHTFPTEVMNANGPTFITPQSHDIADYCARYACAQGAGGTADREGGQGNPPGDPRDRVLP